MTIYNHNNKRHTVSDNTFFWHLKNCLGRANISPVAPDCKWQCGWERKFSKPGESLFVVDVLFVVAGAMFTIISYLVGVVCFENLLHYQALVHQWNSFNLD